MREYTKLIRLLLFGLLILSCQPNLGLAGGNNSKTPTLSELRDRQRDLDTRRERDLRSIQAKLQTQSIDPDEAIMERSRINRDYYNEVSSLRREQDEVFRSLEEKRKPARAGNGSSALPRFQSQSVVTYPQDGEPAPAETPQAEGRQKNVGFGTRELEF
jgi:hypothetical protein